MKKHLIGTSFALLATGLAVLSSCNKDRNNNSIVGTWELSSSHTIEKSTTPPMNVDTVTNYTHGQSILVIFTSGGSITSIDQTGPTDDTISKGTYSFHNNLVVTHDDAGHIDSTNVVISGNTFTVNVSDTLPGYKYSYSAIYNRQ